MKTMKSLQKVAFNMNEGHKISGAKDASDVSCRWTRTRWSLKTGLTRSPGVLG